MFKSVIVPRISTIQYNSRTYAIGNRQALLAEIVHHEDLCLGTHLLPAAAPNLSDAVYVISGRFLRTGGIFKPSKEVAMFWPQPSPSYTLLAGGSESIFFWDGKFWAIAKLPNTSYVFRSEQVLAHIAANATEFFCMIYEIEATDIPDLQLSELPIV